MGKGNRALKKAKREEEKKLKLEKGRDALIKSIPAEVTSKANSLIKISLEEAKYLGLDDENQTPYVSLKYYQSSHQCFSELDKDQLKGFSGFVDKLSQSSWKEIYMSGTKNLSDKTGFGYTVHGDASKLPSGGKVDGLSEDITFIELRMSGESRVHGFRSKSAFCLVWLDRGHDVYK